MSAAYTPGVPRLGVPARGNNLARDPRCGRNFEYLSEDPWHSAVLAAASVTGIQSS